MVAVTINLLCKVYSIGSSSLMQDLYVALAAYLQY